jgi:hypothetical protein
MKLPKKFSLYVGSRDIKNGVRRKADDCPVVLALKRKFPKKLCRVDGFSNPNIRYYVTIGHSLYSICNLGNNFIKAIDYNQLLGRDNIRIILYKVS